MKLRLALFNKLQDKIVGATFLDLFAGVGAMGLEALSRGARFATFVEKERPVFGLIKKNAENLGCQDRCRFVQGDVLKFCAQEKGQYDIIFADPPYGLRRGTQFLSEELIESIGPLLQEGGDFFLEEGVDALDTGDMQRISLKNYGSSYLYHLTTAQLGSR